MVVTLELVRPEPARSSSTWFEMQDAVKIVATVLPVLLGVLSISRLRQRRFEMLPDLFSSRVQERKQARKRERDHRKMVGGAGSAGEGSAKMLVMARILLWFRKSRKPTLM